MSNQRTSLEVIAPSVEEAIAQGLADLGLTEDAVEVEVLDGGTRGLFGIGSRQARVRLTIKNSDAGDRVEPVAEKESEQISAAADSEPEDLVEIEAEGELETADQPAEEETLEAAPTSETEIALRVARETVEELLGKMKIEATVTSSFGKADETRGKDALIVDIEGDDLSILIGPRAETLNALQYIASLIVGKEVGKSVTLVVDVQGYRKRRAQQIRQLALRMADQAIKTGKRQTLEPMPASERRLVHIELRNHPRVTTESVGEEPRRKVTIIPKA
jgi:spoIIIJ-associated protein